MTSSSLVVLDIGGTKIHAGHFHEGKILKNSIHHFSATENADEIFKFIIFCIEQLQLTDFCGIAMGVPSIVDVDKGIVFDTVNIAAWKKVPLKQLLEQHFSKPVYINNDVNCFVVGESLSQQHQGYANIVGLCLGTGFGAGIVLNRQLYMGHNCSAGEAGSIAYLQGTFDDYCSGQFFQDNYNQCGRDLAVQAKQGDVMAQQAFNEFGQHLAEAISNLLFVIDPQLIVIGGSVAHSFDLFIDAVWERLNSFPYRRVIENLKIEKSASPDSALLGVAHLYQHSPCARDDYQLTLDNI
jgi:glucokinase